MYKLLQEKRIASVAILYFLISGTILYKFGINTGGEAAKYIEDAHRILDGENFRSGFFSLFYSAYSLLVSFFIHFSINLNLIAWVQLLLSFAAACSIYKLLVSITGDKRISFLAFIIYLVCIPIQKWIFFLYTESLHTSLVTLGVYFFYCVFQKGETKRWWLLVILIVVIIFSRPVGIIFLFTALLVMLLIFRKKYPRMIPYSITLIIIIACLVLFQTQFVFYFNPDSLRRMEIICQVPQANLGLNYKEYNSAGLSSFFHVISSEIGVKNFLLNGMNKVISFFGMARSFYSTSHNVILVGTGLLLYASAFFAVFFLKMKSARYVKLFSFLYIFFTAAGIFFTCDEWSNRFIAPVLPHVIILAGLGFYWLRLKWISKTETQVGY